MTLERLKRLLEVFDLPGGVILGLFSLSMLGFVCAVGIRTLNGQPTEIPASAMDIYKFIVGVFAASKTVKTIFGKVVGEKES